MDVNSEQSNMKKILEKIISFFKFKTKKVKSEEIIEPEVKRLTYTKRTDN
jgi:hypothetical protein